jgi:hypothetical protein
MIAKVAFPQGGIDFLPTFSVSFYLLFKTQHYGTLHVCSARLIDPPGL